MKLMVEIEKTTATFRIVVVMNIQVESINVSQFTDEIYRFLLYPQHHSNYKHIQIDGISLQYKN